MPANWPQLILEGGFAPGAPVQSGAFTLDDPTFGVLDTSELGESTTWTDFSPFMRSGSVTRAANRQQGPLWAFQQGAASVVLKNGDGRFDPDNLSGPYVDGTGATQLNAMVPVRVRAVFGTVTYPLFSGFADSWIPEDGTNYGGRYAQATVAASDGQKILNGVTLPATGVTGVGETTGARVTRILNAAQWYTGSAQRSVDAGISTVQGYAGGDTAWNLMQEAADAEIGELYVNGSGQLVFRGRRAILTDARSNTPQAVFGDLPTSSLPWQVQWHGDGSTASPIAQSQLTGGVAAGSTYQASALYYSVQGWPSAQLYVNWFTAGGGYISTGTSPVFNVPAGTATPVATGPLAAPATATQYTIVAVMDGTPASSVVMNAAWNHGAAVTELTGFAGPWTWSSQNSATVTDLGAALPSWYPAERAYFSITRARDDTTLANDIQATRTGGTLQEAQDAASVAQYLFPRSYARSDLILQNDSDALSWAQWVLYVSKSDEDRFDQLIVYPLRDPVNLWPQVLGREIGDRIQLLRRPPGVASPVVKDCFIRGIAHAWDWSAGTWQTTWTLQSAAKYGSFMTLDNPVLGQLDANALAFLRNGRTLMASPPVWSVGEVLASADVNNWFVPNAAIRTTNSAVHTGGTPTTDTVLVLTLAASASYEFRIHVIYSGTIAGGFKIALVPPSGATGFYAGSWDTTGGGSFLSSPSGLTGSITQTIGANGGSYSLRMSGSITTGSSGTLAVYYSENGTSTGASLLAGSLIVANRIG